MDRIFKRPFLWPGAAGRVTLEHADRTAGTCGDHKPSPPTAAPSGGDPILPWCSRLRAHAPSSSWTPSSLSTAAVALPRPRSSLHKIFSRERVSSNSENYAISVEILRGPGGANPPDPRQELRPHSPKIPIRLIDPTVSLWLKIFPITLAGGKRLFADGTTSRWKVLH